ncbi:hypothetical protein EV360DRAFT_75897 [Lentinula raphanica]|nr:hypothetical protein EV360DRAFT_75897 [Lentinula raphanica]
MKLVLKLLGATQPAFDFSAALLEAVCREGQGQELNDGLFQPAPTSLRPFPHSSPPSSSFASPLSSPLSSPPSPKLRSLPTLPAEETASSTPPNGSRKRRMKASSKRNRRKKRCIPREADGFSMIKAQPGRSIPISDVDRRVIAVVVYPANETIQTAAEEAASLLRDLRPQASFTNKQNVTGVATFLNYLQALLMDGEERLETQRLNDAATFDETVDQSAAYAGDESNLVPSLDGSTMDFRRRKITWLALTRLKLGQKKFGNNAVGQKD